MEGGNGGGRGDEPFLGGEGTKDFLKYPSHLLGLWRWVVGSVFGEEVCRRNIKFM